ncbi:hypothetical protein [Enterovibrio norvegicus]|uniref:hypothetical protein n=1 Tax=Enterovibrio norvegicus TaxID=188144 RepID=UPI000C85495C|nr:hypothetical protein [Enterovibrio norvegicus]PMH64542.1 hypothetical protein BCU62_15925 [Enterovibrio norvegicus]
MVQAAEIANHNNKACAAGIVQHNETAPRAKTGLGFDGKEIEKLLGQPKLVETIQIISVERFDESDFLGLIGLAEQLGMQNDIDALLSQSELTDLQPFLTTLTETLKQHVAVQVQAKEKALIASLKALLTEQGDLQDCEYFDRFLGVLYEGEKMGELTVSIQDETNNNFDADDKMHLTLRSCEPYVYQQNTLSCPSFMASLHVVRNNAFNSLLIGTSGAIFNCLPDYYLLYDMAQPFLDSYTDATKLYHHLRENYDFGEVYWFDEDNEEGEEIYVGRLLDTMLNAHHAEKVEVESTYLSKWFKSQCKTLPTDCLTRQSHDFPMHYVSNDSDLVEAITANTETVYEDAQCLMFLNPEVAIETLVDVTMNRKLVLLLDALSYFGHENDLSESATKPLGDIPSVTPIFVIAQ